jgi:integrase
MVRRQYDTLRAILNAAVETGLIARSPCRGIRLPDAQATTRAVLDAEAVHRLAEALGPDYGAMAYLGAVLGLRWGEVGGLRVESIDFLARTVTMAEQRTRGGKAAMVTRRPKSRAGRRTITVPDWLIDVLASHVRHRGLTAADPRAVLFVTRDGAGLDYGHWRQRRWLPATDAAGLSGLQFPRPSANGRDRAGARAHRPEDRSDPTRAR